MKYLITESKFNSLIKKTLLNRFPTIGGVTFTKYPVLLGDTREIIERTNIIIFLDPKQHFSNPLGEAIKIKKFIVDYFIPDLYEYGNPYGVRIHHKGKSL